jgi:hypothetical protein
MDEKSALKCNIDNVSWFNELVHTPTNPFEHGLKKS